MSERTAAAGAQRHASLRSGSAQDRSSGRRVVAAHATAPRRRPWVRRVAARAGGAMLTHVAAAHRRAYSRAHPRRARVWRRGSWTPCQRLSWLPHRRASRLRRRGQAAAASSRVEAGSFEPAVCRVVPREPALLTTAEIACVRHGAHTCSRLQALCIDTAPNTHTTRAGNHERRAIHKDKLNTSCRVTGKA